MGILVYMDCPSLGLYGLICIAQVRDYTGCCVLPEFGLTRIDYIETIER